MKFAASMKFIVTKPYLVALALLLFLAPLVVSQNTNELYEFPKMFFVYFFATAVIGFFLSDLVLNPIKLKKPSLVVVAFLLANIVSTVFSSHRYTSVWGYYTRFNDGLVSNLLFFGLYFVALNKLSKEDLVKLLKVSCLTVVPVGIAGILEHLGIGTSTVSRVYSTFGQPNWLAQYLAMLLPFILFLSLEENFGFWLMVYVAGFSCLWFTYSVSGILGFIVGFLVLGLVIWKMKMLNKRTFAKTAVVITVSLIIAASNAGLFSEKINDAYKDFKKSISAIQKVYALDNEHQVSDPGFIRFGLWQGSVNLVFSSVKNFLIGTGPETFAYAFQPFRLTSLNYSSEWDYVFNKPHNYYLGTWSELGTLGLLSYLVLLVWLAKRLPKYLLPSFAGFVITNIFGWPVVATALLFWVWIAFAEAD